MFLVDNWCMFGWSFALLNWSRFLACNHCTERLLTALHTCLQDTDHTTGMQIVQHVNQGCMICTPCSLPWPHRFQACILHMQWIQALWMKQICQAGMPCNLLPRTCRSMCLQDTNHIDSHLSHWKRFQGSRMHSAWRCLNRICLHRRT